MADHGGIWHETVTEEWNTAEYDRAWHNMAEHDRTWQESLIQEQNRYSCFQELNVPLNIYKKLWYEE